jgi:hypothetical protein
VTQKLHDFSQSGVAEKDAIFLTKDEDRLEAVGTLINYDPFNQVEYLIVMARDTVECFSIRLREINKNMTELEWTILYSVFGNWTQKNTR